MAIAWKPLCGLGLAACILAACGSDSGEPSGDITPPDVPEIESSETDALAEAIAADVDAVDLEDAGDEVTSEAMDEVHSDHDHDHDEDEHDHSDDAHDHDDHAGGAPHVHGLGELAVARDGATYSVSLMAPSPNFGLAESETSAPEGLITGEKLVLFVGGDCEETGAHVHVNSDDGHGDVTVDLTYSCAAPDAVSAVQILAFDTYEGFEEIDAVWLSDTGQEAAELDASSPVLSLK